MSGYATAAGCMPSAGPWAQYQAYQPWAQAPAWQGSYNPLPTQAASPPAYPYGVGGWQYGQPPGMVYPWQSGQPAGMQLASQAQSVPPPQVPSVVSAGNPTVNPVHPDLGGSTPSSSVLVQAPVPVAGAVDMDLCADDARPESEDESESGSSDSSGEGKGSGEDDESDSDESVPLPPLPAEERVNGFPLDTHSILSRVAQDLGIAYESRRPAVTPSVFSATCPLLSDSVEPALTLPADLASVWEAAKSPPSKRAYKKGCLVTDDDFNQYLKVPTMDPEIHKRLPVEGKVDHGTYSPYWEECLKSVDSRLRATIRFSAFSSTVAEHLTRLTAAGSGSASEIAREAYLLSDLSHKSLQSSMSAAHRLTSLRQSNALSLLSSIRSSSLLRDFSSVTASASWWNSERER